MSVFWAVSVDSTFMLIPFGALRSEKLKIKMQTFPGLAVQI